MNQKEFETALAKKASTFRHDPLGFVLWAFPWGEKGGPLYKYDGPDEWQAKYLDRMGKEMSGQSLEEDEKGETGKYTVQMSTSSGHGIGKSALTAMIILWFISVHGPCAGNITANTWSQLNTKTWRELAVWKERAINGHWFEITTTRIFHKDHKETWGVNALSNSDKNSEAFAGLHDENATLILYDEASAIPDSIWEVSEGALTDPRINWHNFGNPTRNQGRFKECWGKFKQRWITQQIDSRSAMMTDKKKIAEWAEDYGEDSDFMRVRVRGIFPRAASDQLIDEEVIESAASHTSEPRDFINYPKILGVDVSRGGGDDSVIVLRQGPKLTIVGTYQLRDLMELAGKVVESFNTERASHIYIDSTGLGAGIYDRLKQLGLPVTGVSFGTSPIDGRMYANTRAEIWGRMREWLGEGADIPRHNKLIEELKQQTYGYTEKLQIQLESKKAMKARGLESPDIADAIATTFYGDSLALLKPTIQHRVIQQASATGWS